MSGLTDQQRMENAVARELWVWRGELLRRAAELYPIDMFPPVTEGAAHCTPDGAAAAMARHVYTLVARDLGERSILLTHDEPDAS